MTIEPDYVPRFVPADKVPALLEAWRMTAVGWTVRHAPHPGIAPHSRHGRMLRAAAAFAEAHPGVTTDLGAYKDLDGLLGVHAGRVLA